MLRHREKTPRRARLLLETLEDRIVPSWAGVPPTTIGTPAAVAVTLNSQAAASGSAAITANEVDYYRFTATRTGAYTLRALTPSSNLDSVLGVFNSSGQRLAFNDDISSSNLDSQLSLNLTAGATYYFGITNYTGSVGGAYTWSVTGPAGAADDAFENNDTLATASNLGTLTAVRNVTGLAMADAADWYRFTVGSAPGSAGNVRINFQHTQGDLDLALYSSAGTRLRLSDSTTNAEQVSLSGLAAGTYFVHVYGYRGAFNPGYSLTVDPALGTTPPPPPPPTGGFQIDLALTGLTSSQQTIFRQAAARWAQIITGDLPNATYNGQTVDDLLIHGSAVAIDGRGGILGQAGPDRFRSGTSLPYHGSMEFDSADMAQMEADGSLYGVVLHEMGHILGIGTLWQSRGFLQGAGTSNPRYTGSQATAAYNAIFGRNETSVPVENTGGSGTRDAHWRESVFGTEVMSAYAGPGNVFPISRVTVGGLADLGYQVNFAAADSFTPSSSAALSAGGSSGSASLRDGATLVAAMSVASNANLDQWFRVLGSQSSGQASGQVAPNSAAAAATSPSAGAARGDDNSVASATRSASPASLSGGNGGTARHGWFHLLEDVEERMHE